MKIGEKTSFVMLPLECKLRLGYTNKYMTANITKIEIVDGKNTDLHIDKPVYAIYLANVCVGRGGLMFEKEAKEWAKENGKPITSGCLE